MGKVLIFKETLLPPSETFIQNQVGALRTYRACFAGLERSHPSLTTPDDAILLSEARPAFADLRAKLYRRTGFAPAFHQQVRQFRPDLIHAHFASGGRTALHLMKALRVPLIVTMHGADITAEGRRGRYKELGERASLFLCVSEFIRQKALDAGLPADKLCVHYIGIDREVFRSASGVERGNHVLFVGRLVEKKGCEYVLRAMREVQAVYPECALRIVGEGPLRKQLQRLAGQLGVDCQFLGFQPADLVRQEMQRARIFCAPSVVAANGDSEGLGTVFLEAQAMGLPVVTSKHAGMAEAVLHGLTGFLCPERDATVIAQSIVTLLNDTELWTRYHLSAIQLVQERFDLKRQAALLEDLYAQVTRVNVVTTEGGREG